MTPWSWSQCCNRILRIFVCFCVLAETSGPDLAEMKRINSQIIWLNTSPLYYISNMALYLIQLIFNANDFHVSVFINLSEASVFYVISNCISCTIFVKGRVAALRVSLHFECYTTQSCVTTCATIHVTATRFAQDQLY